MSPNPIPSSPGTGGSLPASSIAPDYILRRAGLASSPNWKRSLCASPERTPAWGYDRIVGALTNLGHTFSDQTVGNILRRYGIQPAPKRSQNTTWKDFIASHMSVLAGTDFFTVEVLTWRGLATYYALFFIHLESRRVGLAGLTKHPTAEWMIQMARNATAEGSGFLRGMRYLLHDRDTKFCAAFLDILRSSGIRPFGPATEESESERFLRALGVFPPARMPVQTHLFGEASLRRALNEYIEHHHFERNHQGKGNLLLLPSPDAPLSPNSKTVRCRNQLGGLLKFYSRVA